MNDDFASKLKTVLENNAGSISKRAEFLVKIKSIQTKMFIEPDVAAEHCFWEAQESYIIGIFVGCILLCATSIERQLAWLLKMPANDPANVKAYQEEVGNKLAKSAMASGLIDDCTKKLFDELFRLRNNYVHGLNSIKNCRPQFEEPWKNSVMWMQPEMYPDVENDAKEALVLMFLIKNRINYDFYDKEKDCKQKKQ